MKKKNILCLGLTAVMCLGLTVNAFANTYTGESGWTSTYDGKKITSNFTSTQMSDTVSNIQPGDEVTMQVTIVNNYSADTDWYMTNDVLQSLEDSVSVAEGGAYTYILSYKSADGTTSTTLFDSDTVGGESTEGGVGLNQATNATGSDFYLDRLSKGDSGTVYLTVKLDGETQGNDYQDTLAKLQVNFAVEPVSTSGTSSGSGNGTKATGGSNGSGASYSNGLSPVKTGDTNLLLIYSTICLAAGLVFVFFFVAAMKKRRQREEA